MVEFGFFDSINGDRKYNSDNFSDYFEGLISGGVYGYVGEKLKVSPGDGMNVVVGTGRAMIMNRYVKNTALLPISISSADSLYPRSDAVVVGVDMQQRIGFIKVIQGTPGESAERPEIPFDGNTQCYVLAYIRIDANATSISVENIYDMRGTSECPWVTGFLGQIDGSGIADQYRAMIDKFKEESEGTKEIIDKLQANKDIIDDLDSKVNEIQALQQKVDNIMQNLSSGAYAQMLMEVIAARTSSISGDEFSTLSERLASDFANLQKVMQAVDVVSPYIVVDIEKGDDIESNYYANDTLRITGTGSIDASAFEHREDFSAVEIDIGGNVGVGAFGGCTELNTASVNCLKICNNAFMGCSKLSSITIGKNVTEIGSGILTGSGFYIPNGVRIMYAGTIAQWNAITKADNWTGDNVVIENNVVICTDGNVEV